MASPERRAAGRSPLLDIASRRYERGERQPPHRHDYDGITLVLRGDLTESVAGWLEAASALSVVFKPAGVLHGLEVGDEGASTLQIVLAAGTLAGALPSLATPDRVSIVPAGWRWTHAGPAAAEILRSAVAPGAPIRMRSRADREGARHAVARLLRLFSEEMAGTPTPGRRETSAAPAWLARVLDSLDGAAEGARLGAAARAARLLGDPRHSLADVAGEAGYSDQSHLCRDFRGSTGVTPMAYRRAALGG